MVLQLYTPATATAMQQRVFEPFGIILDASKNPGSKSSTQKLTRLASNTQLGGRRKKSKARILEAELRNFGLPNRMKLANLHRH